MQTTDANAAALNAPQALSVDPTSGCHSQEMLINPLSGDSSSAASEAHA